MLGSNAGSVHDQRQGTGRATVLQGSRALDTYDGLAAIDRAGKAAKAAEQNKAFDEIIKFNPDRWYKHETKIQQAVNDWQQKGAEMVAKGINPYKATDQASIDWRKRQVVVAGMAGATKQMEDYYKTVQSKVTNADPDKYTSATLQDALDWFDNTDLEDAVVNGLTPPPLMQTKPMLQLQEHFSKVMGPINTSKGENVMTDEERWKIVDQTLNDPNKADDLAESISSLMQQMTPERKAETERRARDNNRSVMQQVGYDYVTRYETQRKPFEYDKWKKSLIERVDVPYKDWRGADSFSKKAKEGELNRIIRTVAEDGFYGDDRALQEYEAQLPRKQGETDGAYMKRAADDVAVKLRKEIAVQEMAGVTQSGQDKKDFEVSQKTWLPDIMSKDPDKYREAAGYITGLKGVMGNMTVMDSRVMQGTPDPVFRLTLKGALSLDQVKSQVPNGLGDFVTETKEQGTDTDVFIPITTQTENYLLTFHDLKLKQTGIPFGGEYTTTPPTKISGMMPDAPAPSNLINAPAIEPFKFKPK